MFKAPDGTKAKLRKINRNVSAVVRAAVEKMIESSGGDSAFDKARHLCGVFKGGARDASTSKDYLNQYAPKRHR